MASRIENTRRNIASGLVFRGVCILLPFVNRTAILWTLGAEYTGLSSLFGSILQVLSITELGFNTAVVYGLYKPFANGDEDAICEMVSMLRRIYHVVGAIIMALGLSLMPFLPLLIKGSYPESISLQALFFLYLLNSSVSYFLFSYKECLLIADQRQDVANNVRSAVHVFSYLLQLAVLVLTRNFYAFVAVNVVGTVATNLLINAETRRRYPFLRDVGGRVSVPPDVRRQVGGLLVNRLSDTFRNSLDSVIISSTIGLVATAVYGNYYYVYSSLYGVMLVVCNSMGASVGNSIVLRSARENFEDMLDFSFLFSFVLGWSAVAMACLYQPFMCLWAGESMILPLGDMLLFVLYYYLINMNNIRNQYVSGTGMWWQLKGSYIAETIANVVLNILLGYLLGITGVLIATVVTIFFFNYLQRNAVLFRGYFHGMPALTFYRQQFYYLFAAAVSLAATYWACRLISPGLTAVSLAVRAALCLTVAPVVLLVLYRASPRWGDGTRLFARVVLRRGGRQEVESPNKEGGEGVGAGS